MLASPVSSSLSPLLPWITNLFVHLLFLLFFPPSLATTILYPAFGFFASLSPLNCSPSRAVTNNFYCFRRGISCPPSSEFKFHANQKSRVTGKTLSIHTKNYKNETNQVK
ncbi:hypothetical protein BKA67DRAFT_254908 [Truncatella angustata]|uniref:Uncharacterized protein n=1 Tax=Truncatella angustata TaxID=152316 RepID=A0A9P8UNS4_9PEZI|nr:uncharacterized protein BKA67DRAFT_254908 [Truncatella angustata]KAH6656084.1 hypothetical protein BKA67DRAFT_254908 [Truncatella angustata]